MNDFNENLINQKMDKAIISFQNDLNGIRAGRASINMLDNIGSEFFLSTIPCKCVRLLKKICFDTWNFIYLGIRQIILRIYKSF